MKSILFGFILVLLQASCVPAKYPVGTRVLALKDDNKYYPAQIDQVNSGTITVRFDNQQRTVNYPSNTESMIIPNATTPFLHNQAHVIAKKDNQASHWNFGFVVGIVGSGKARRFNVVIDGNATPEIYNNSQLRFLANPNSVQTVGARVIAKGPRTTGASSYFRGFVVGAEGSSLSIILDNGNTVNHAKSNTAAVIRDELPFTTRLTDDKNVIAAVQPGGDEYASAVIRGRRRFHPKFIVKFAKCSQPIRDYYHIRLVPGQ
ncbi:uncharacterized protein LOC144642040 [Oculina patagonica]